MKALYVSPVGNIHPGDEIEIRMVKVNITGHKHGKYPNTGDDVDEDKEEDWKEFPLFVNKDNDEEGPYGQKDNRDVEINDDDDDIMKLVLEKISHPDRGDNKPKGTIKLKFTMGDSNANSSVNVYQSESELLDEFEVRLSEDNAYLCGVKNNDVNVWFESRKPSLNKTSGYLKVEFSYVDENDNVVDSDEIHVIMVQVDLKRVDYWGQWYWWLKSDDGNTDYKKDHWEDNSTPLDGNANGPKDKKYPVCFNIDSDLQITATWEVVPPDLGLLFTIEGEGSDNHTFPSVDSTPSGGELKIVRVRSYKKINQTNKDIGYYEEFRTHWDLFIDHPTSIYRGACRSKNQLYAVRPRPFLYQNRYHSVIHISCIATEGLRLTETDLNDKLTNRIWNKFASLSVSRVDDKQLTFYKDYNTTNAYHADMLQDSNGDGTCSAWMNLYIATRRTQGIVQNAECFIIRPTQSNGFIIKEWEFDEIGTSGDLEYPYLNVPYPQRDNKPLKEKARYNWLYSEVKDVDGWAGQGNENPASLFGAHAITIREANGTEYYDPSLGRKLSSIQAIKNTIKGFFIIVPNYPLDETKVDWDLNGNTTKTDTGVETIVYLFKKNPPGEGLSTDRQDFQ